MVEKCQFINLANTISTDKDSIKELKNRPEMQKNLLAIIQAVQDEWWVALESSPFRGIHTAIRTPKQIEKTVRFEAQQLARRAQKVQP